MAAFKARKRCTQCGATKDRGDFYPYRAVCKTCYTKIKAQRLASGLRKPSKHRRPDPFATCLKCRRTLPLREENFPPEQDPDKRRCLDCIAERARKQAKMAARKAAKIAAEAAEFKALEEKSTLKRLPRVWYPGNFLKDQ